MRRYDLASRQQLQLPATKSDLYEGLCSLHKEVRVHPGGSSTAEVINKLPEILIIFLLHVP